MPPLDLLDSVTSGHMTNPSPEREPAANSLDGPGDGRPTPRISQAYDPNHQPPRNATPVEDNYPPPPTSPPPYHPTPQQQPRLFFSRNPVHRGLKAFLAWVRLVYLDIFFMLCVLAVVHVIMRLSHFVFRWDKRYFPMTWDPVSEKWYGPAELSYPYSPFIVSVTSLAVLIPAVGAAVVVGMQVRVRSFWDANAGLFGLAKGLVMMTFFQVFLKQWIGSFRPYFITVCNPVLLPPILADPFPFRRFITPAYCNPNVPKSVLLLAMQSFPSGHTSESFFVGMFLALYLNAKLKAFADYHTGFWKWLAVMSPLFGSCLAAGTLAIDRNHHIHDILLSAPWGILVAFLAYRSHYASVFDYRKNHLPLPWSGTRQSLRPTIPAPETGHGYNLAAVRWPRKPVEHSFNGEGEQSTGLGVDGAAERPRGLRNLDGAAERPRGPRNPDDAAELQRGLRNLIDAEERQRGPRNLIDAEEERQRGLRNRDRAAERPRGPGDINRGTPRRMIFPMPPPSLPLMQNRTGAIVPDNQGGFMLRDVVDVGRVEPDVGAAGPSTARATGHQVDLEGQRQRTWTQESGEDMG